MPPTSPVRRFLPPAAYVALSVADTLAAGSRSDRARAARRVLKPALMPALTVAFWDATRDAAPANPAAGRLRTTTAAAQVLSCAGDVALLGTGRRAFLTGVGSFFAAHLAYLRGLLGLRGRLERSDRTALGVAGAFWGVAVPALSTAAARKDPGLRVPVAAYASVLTAMFAASRTLDADLPADARRTLQAGTALFLLSDTVLAVQEFVLPQRNRVLESVVMATYTAGQGLIARGAVGVLGPTSA